MLHGLTLNLLESTLILTATAEQNYQLLSYGYLPVSVAKENRLDYYNALEQYAVKGDLSPFADFVAELEKHQLDEYMKLC